MSNSTSSTATLLVDINEAARLLGVSPRTVWGLTAPRGDLPCVRVGRTVRYPTAALATWVAEHQCNGQ